MIGGEALLATLVDSQVDACFANPGTSEMHVVAALDRVPGMRAVLTLFEGVATGAADGYARVAGRPAATLLHLGPGLGNGVANLHNARRAHSPVVNVVGDHATGHKRLDPPLESDLVGLAATVSGWVKVSEKAGALAADAAEAVAASYGPPGCVATLVVPADLAWSETGAGPAGSLPVRAPSPVGNDALRAAITALRSGEPAALLLGGRAVRERGLMAAGAIAGACGARLFCESFPANLERGAGLPAPERLAYLAEFVEAQLSGLRHLILAGATSPVSFFAYPGRPGDLVPDGCEVHQLAGVGDDVTGGLQALAAELGAAAGVGAAPGRPGRPSGALTMQTLADAVGALLPEGAVVVDESNTSGLFVPAATAGAPRHDWLTLTGGAIGFGLPAATGAAVAAEGRKVLCLEADGSAMYTAQALWTQAREGLDVTTVVLANRAYDILNLELSRVGAEGSGPRASAMLDLSDPELDFVSLAKGLGVPAVRTTTADELTVQLERALATEGPSLIEAAVPPLSGGAV
jgi:acetolactate synthase-1/2/3 large subunit